MITLNHFSAKTEKGKIVPVDLIFCRINFRLGSLNKGILGSTAD